MRSGNLSPRLSSGNKQVDHQSDASLASWVSIGRRYTRAVNLDRDFGSLDSLNGYVITPRAIDALERVLDAFALRKQSRAFTVTSVYGTGKSAFAQFLTALTAPTSDPSRSEALRILSQSGAVDIAEKAKRAIPDRGLLRAVATARKESAASVVVRALAKGANEFVARGRPPAIVRTLSSLAKAAEHGKSLDSSIVPSLAGALADGFKSGLLITIDELGKVLEHAAQSTDHGDLYLLQQLAEMPTSPGGHPISVIGLLHQTFADYGASLTATGRNEWQKIQGRFEDIPYSEAPEYLLSLVQAAVSHEKTPPHALAAFGEAAKAWHKLLKREKVDSYVASVLSPEAIGAVTPLHPIAALLLPVLCSKYAQHDRSLFAFLTSNEPHSFSRFLQEHSPSGDSIPLQPLSALYDYFIDTAGQSLVIRPQFQRWAEVHNIVGDARSLPPDQLEALKTIGVLNLAAAAGPHRASRGLVLLALMNSPDAAARQAPAAAIDALLRKGLVTYRSQLDEYRIWEGSEFDIERALAEHGSGESRSLSAMLSDLQPLHPLVAQRHSYQTGTLRFFERQYVDDTEQLGKPKCALPDSDGVLLYWLGERLTPRQIPQQTVDGRPVVVLAPASVYAVRQRAEELSALRALLRLAELQSDAVARKEVQARIQLAERELTNASRAALNPADACVWFGGRLHETTEVSLNSELSVLCDRAYESGIALHNELVNRRDLTSNGARARGEVIEALLTRSSEERLGIVGDGPDASLYESVLGRTGIHRFEKDRWVVGPPRHAGIRPLWDAIDGFCIESRTEPSVIDKLFETLDRPPYGVKRGIVPLVLAAVLVYRSDDVSIYFQGSFVPTLGPEHFELLVKQPQSFSVKHIELTGIRSQVFRELESLVLSTDKARAQTKPLRNATLLTVVSPLVRFAVKLPSYTVQTKKLSNEAQAVRDALRSAREPDALLFRVLPEALGLVPFDSDERDATHRAATFRQSLRNALRDLEGAYDRLLERSAILVHKAFGTAGDPSGLRADLRIRAQYLVGAVIDRRMQALILAAVNDRVSDREWLEALVMIIADRPAESWSDEDALAFELRLSDVARRFANLSALVHDKAAAGLDGFDARRLTITRADGSEDHKLVWIDNQSRDAIDRIAREVGVHVEGLPREQQFAVAALVAENVFASADESSIAPIITSRTKPTVIGQTARRRGKNV